MYDVLNLKVNETISDNLRPQFEQLNPIPYITSKY